MKKSIFKRGAEHTSSHRGAGDECDEVCSDESKIDEMSDEERVDSVIIRRDFKRGNLK